MKLFVWIVFSNDSESFYLLKPLSKRNQLEIIQGQKI